MKKILSLFHLLGLSMIVLSNSLYAEPRWYAETQVEEGKKLFTEHCMSCHGDKAQGTKEWKKVDKDGKFPPPPLNGEAHAWHHSLDILRRTVREGGIKLGGSMPSFKEKLTAEQVDAVIAYFQSQWNEQIYNTWSSRNKPPINILQKLSLKDLVSEDAITSYLKKMVPDREIGAPVKTIVPSILQVKLGNNYVYLSDDGRYLLTGELIDLKTQKNLTREKKAKDTVVLMAQYSEKNKIIFPAEGDEKTSITAFTDVSCPYCRKLHSEVPSLQKAGVTVKYIAFPRSGLQGDAFETMKSVWCSDDRQKALGIAKGNHTGTVDKKDCEAGKAVDQGYELGQRIGISGTPALILENGEIIEGYVPHKQLVRRLGL